MDYSEYLYKGSALTNDISLKCCGKRLDALNHRFGPAARENCFLILLKRGCGILTVNKKDFELNEGMLFVCFPGIVTSYRAKSGSVWDISWVGISGENLTVLLDYIGLNIETPLMVPRNFEYSADFFEQIYNLHNNTIKSNIESQGLLYTFLASLMPDNLTEESEEDNILRAVRYIKHNFDRDIEIYEIADYVGLERVYFSKLFKKRTGLSPKDMLTKYRMEKSVYFMETKGLSVSEAARSVGYEDPLYFSRAFKRHFGVCPTEYLKNIN